MFTEARNDRKLDLLSDAQFRVWWKLLLYSCEEEPRGTFFIGDRPLLALEVAKNKPKLLDDALAKMCDVRLIEIDGDYGYFPAFTTRQYMAGGNPSEAPDSVAERKRKQRARERLKAV